jgi:hypothetical protein
VNLIYININWRRGRFSYRNYLALGQDTCNLVKPLLSKSSMIKREGAAEGLDSDGTRATQV